MDVSDANCERYARGMMPPEEAREFERLAMSQRETANQLLDWLLQVRREEHATFRRWIWREARLIAGKYAYLLDGIDEDKPARTDGKPEEEGGRQHE